MNKFPSQICFVIFLGSLWLPLASADHVYSLETNLDYEEDLLLESHIDGAISANLSQFTICGRGQDGWDDCQEDTKSKVVLRYKIADGKLGNLVRLSIDNLGAPHYVQLEVKLCWNSHKNSIILSNATQLNSTSIMCKDSGPKILEHDESHSFEVFSIKSDEYFLIVNANGGTKGDETKFEVLSTTLANSNNDRQEPEYIYTDEKYHRKVCQNGCEDDTEDPVDVFSYFAFSGDTINIKVWSRGNQGECEDGWFDSNQYKVRFYWYELRELPQSTIRQHVKLDESLCATPYSTTTVMQQTGFIYFYFIAHGASEDKRSTSYSIKVSEDTNTRLNDSDLDEDSWTDFDEYVLCSTDYQNSSSVPLDTDLDGDCDKNDPDDDNDSVPDVIDSCSKVGGYDYDRDGCPDYLDYDVDGDNILDATDICKYSDRKYILGIDEDTDQDGCYDGEDEDDDNDGVNDEQDKFPFIYSQRNDFDEDGYGDNLSGYMGDSCPNVFGTSYLDRNGCLDGDSDGYSNTDENWNATNGADVFEDDPTQWSDIDEDGYGDNYTGKKPDYCPLTPGTSSIGKYLGCLDSDSDGYSDLEDNCLGINSCWQGFILGQYDLADLSTEFLVMLVWVGAFILIKRPKRICN